MGFKNTDWQKLNMREGSRRLGTCNPSLDASTAPADVGHSR